MVAGARHPRAALAPMGTPRAMVYFIACPKENDVSLSQCPHPEINVKLDLRLRAAKQCTAVSKRLRDAHDPGKPPLAHGNGAVVKSAYCDSADMRRRFSRLDVAFSDSEDVTSPHFAPTGPRSDTNPRDSSEEKTTSGAPCRAMPPLSAGGGAADCACCCAATSAPGAPPPATAVPPFTVS